MRASVRAVVGLAMVVNSGVQVCGLRVVEHTDKPQLKPATSILAKSPEPELLEMDSMTLTEKVKFLGSINITLSIDDRLNLELAMDTLQSQLLMEDMRIWGKFHGLDEDYYVVVGVNFSGQKNMADKKFFWCTRDKWQLSSLPEPLEKPCSAVFDQIQVLFSGEPHRVIVKVDGSSDIVSLDDTSLVRNILKKDIIELDRLSYVVRQIDHDCTIVPMGALKKTPLNEVAPNEAFHGLMLEEVCDIHNYVHFREQCREDKKDAGLRLDDVFTGKFLDNAADDMPTGVWTVKKDLTQRFAILTNKKWPGATFFHRANTQVYGGIYIGNGLKNVDLAFMI